jgi:hypothetical protein
MASTDGTDSRARLVDMLLEKVAEDVYPSGTMMDLIEELLQPDEVPAYAAVLIQKMRDDAYPSITMMRRVAALLGPA